MNKSKDSFLTLVIKHKLKQAILYWIDIDSDIPKKRIDLVYSDNLEDIKTQLLFMGYKILERSKQQYMHVVYYNLTDI
jgi:hypothetical protein